MNALTILAYIATALVAAEAISALLGVGAVMLICAASGARMWWGTLALDLLTIGASPIQCVGLMRAAGIPWPVRLLTSSGLYSGAALSYLYPPPLMRLRERVSGAIGERVGERAGLMAEWCAHRASLVSVWVELSREHWRSAWTKRPTLRGLDAEITEGVRQKRAERAGTPAVDPAAWSAIFGRRRPTDPSEN